MTKPASRFCTYRQGLATRRNAQRLLFDDILIVFTMITTLKPVKGLLNVV